MHRLLLLILTLTLALPAASHAAPAAAPPDSVFGVNSHIASRYPDFGSLSRAADAVADSGAAWSREDFQMHRIEPTRGRFDWGFTDRMVDLLSARGVKIVGVLGPAAGWATPYGGDGSGASFYPPDPALFAEYAGAVVARYKGRVSYWQVWNEPENAIYWQPQPDPAAYAALLKATSAAIKAADAGATVISAGVVPFDQSFIRSLHANGAWASFDILAVHPYVDPATPEQGQIGAAGVAAIKAFADGVGPKPIWVTEFGWAAGPGDRDPNGVTSEDQQASYLVRAAALLRAAGAERIFWYSLKDEGTGRNPYGLYRRGGGATDYGQVRPARDAFRTMAEQLAGTSPAGLLDLGGRQVVWSFDPFGSWRRGDQPNGALDPSTEQARSGTAAKLSYNFPTADNDYVVFSARPAIEIGSPSQLGIWVFGDGSGHTLKVWLTDSQGETLQFRLGAIGSGWQFLSAAIGGPVADYNHVSGGGNLRLDFPAKLSAIVLDDDPDGASGSGAIYLDDITAVSGAESYAARFVRGGEVVDVVWAPNGGQVSIPTSSGQGRLVDRSGASRTLTASGGSLTFDAGPSPVFVSHTPGAAQPQPQPQPPSAPPAGGRCRSFPETGKQACGRILEYWEQNGGLPVFGYPITDQAAEKVEGQTLQVQTFERNRLELHPENAAPYDVLLGRLGAVSLERQGRDWQRFPKADPTAPNYFAETGQAIAPEFIAAWRSNGLEFDGQPGTSFAESLALFGLPLSPASVEVNPTNGQQYLTQHFERARFEYHPENAPPYNVLLGLLGRELSGIK